MNQILVVGAGAVGGFFGGMLARKHPGIAFLLRPRTLEVIQERGLTVRSSSLGTWTVHPQAASDPRDLPPPDAVLLAVKAYDVEEACRQLAPVLGPQTVIVTLQNGVAVEDALIARFGRERIIGGMALIYARLVRPGVIEHRARGGVCVGEMMGNETPRLQRLVARFRETDVPCRVSADIRRDKWEKMCWNCAFNPLTVLVNDRVAKVLARPDLHAVIDTLVREVSAVAMAHRIPLDDDMAEKVIRRSQELRDIHTSMYDDWKAGRRTEIDYLNGYVVRKGREWGIPTPVNDTLTALVKAMTEPDPSGGPEVRIEGAVHRPLTLDRTALAGLSSDFQIPDVQAVSPGMTGGGVKVAGILQFASLHDEADHVTFHSQDGRFSASLRLDQAREHGILVYQLGGGAFPVERGGPFRLITPGLGDLCANVKQVARIEVTRGPGKDTRPPTICS